MKDNSSKKLTRYFKYNISKIFLLGVLMGVIFMAIHVVTRAFDSQKISMKYNAKTHASYKSNKGIDVDICWEMVKNTEYKEQINAYLGRYVTYETFCDNLRFIVKEESITVSYTDDSQVRAKRIANVIKGKLCRYLKENNNVEEIISESITEAEEIKVTKEPRIRLGITYFTELGIVVGWVLGIIIFFIAYYSNGRIKTKADIEDELHMVVLAELPYVTEIVK